VLLGGLVEVGGSVGLVLGGVAGELGFGDGVVLGLVEFVLGLVLFGFDEFGLVASGFVELGLFGFGEVVSGVDGVCCVCGVVAGGVVDPGWLLCPVWPEELPAGELPGEVWATAHVPQASTRESNVIFVTDMIEMPPDFRFSFLK
jgi:hypothetical protein